MSKRNEATDFIRLCPLALPGTSLSMYNGPEVISVFSPRSAAFPISRHIVLWP